ncbi:MAG TPA: twin-arginine translocase TatA/TatE family subunit [Solirubrobacteraceae bacterium]|jgi:sec-independent protein translocase protein TatA|nr:twin-arginine translocase TatA/TatE family subunit [Solirubrobacteraceae bacterium]
MFRNPTTDLIVVLVIVLLIFGPKRLPGLGKQLGTGLREFKESITGENKHEDEDEDVRPEITAASVSTPQAAPTPAPAERESAEVGPQSRS